MSKISSIHIIQPAIWLIVLIVGLPQLSETVYTPSLPDIAHALGATESMVEYTLSVYLLGFAIGTLFWGRLSDKLGRKPCVLAGLVIFTMGCVGCYYSHTIEMLLISRVIQAFGGSIGSVLGQAICRDAFHGAALGKVYSTVGSALALFPAIGPLFGGVIAQYWNWSAIFLLLMAFACALIWLASFKLPETHMAQNRSKVSVVEVAIQLISDKRVLSYGFVVAGCNGMLFSYFAEGPFCLMQILGLSPSVYGLSFVLISCCTMLGGIASRKLQGRFSSDVIMQYGLIIILFSTALLSLVILIHSYWMIVPVRILIFAIVLSQMVSMFGVCMANSNALALALVDYKWCVGTASSLFGFGYYCIISLFTFGMGLLHTGSLLPMPLYFFCLACSMLGVLKVLLK